MGHRIGTAKGLVHLARSSRVIYSARERWFGEQCTLADLPVLTGVGFAVIRC